MRSNYLVILLGFLFMLQSCTESKGSDAGTILDAEATEAAPELVKVISDRPSFSITLPGELKPYEEVNIYPKIKGFIKIVLVGRGSYVKKRQ